MIYLKPIDACQTKSVRLSWGLIIMALQLLCAIVHCWIIQYGNGYPDNKFHGANLGPIWGRQDPGGPHVGPTNLAIWVMLHLRWKDDIVN